MRSGLVLILVCYRGKTLICFGPHFRHRGSSVPGAGVASHGVHECVGGEGVVCGPRAHVLLEALNDRPVSPEHQTEH